MTATRDAGEVVGDLPRVGVRVDDDPRDPRSPGEGERVVSPPPITLVCASTRLSAFGR